MYEEMSLLEFQQAFGSEEACLKYLFEKRWPEEFQCPHCGQGEYYFLKKRRLYQCRACGYQASVTAGTIFHKTRTPLRDWFWMIFLMSRQKAGVSMLALQKMLKMPSYQTVWTMGQKIRQAMASRNERYALKGLVEMDDAFFGGKGRGKRGRGAAKKATVRVMAENRDDHPGFAAMQVVDELDAETVKKTAERWISAGETIKTDQYSSFGILTRSSFQHETDPVTYPEQASVRFPWVHTVISNCKNQLKGTQRGVSRKHLHRYLSEYCYRFNRRFWENQLFDRLFPLTDDHLFGANWITNSSFNQEPQVLPVASEFVSTRVYAEGVTACSLGLATRSELPWVRVGSGSSALPQRGYCRPATFWQ